MVSAGNTPSLSINDVHLDVSGQLIEKHCNLWWIFRVEFKICIWLGLVDDVCLDIALNERKLVNWRRWIAAMDDNSDINFSELIGIDWNIELWSELVLLQNYVILWARLHHLFAFGL